MNSIEETRPAIATLTRSVRVMRDGFSDKPYPTTEEQEFSANVRFHQFVTRCDDGHEYVECLIEFDDGSLRYCGIDHLRFTDRPNHELGDGEIES